MTQFIGMKPQYNYPDPGDAITFKVIDTYQHISNYWSNSEKWILRNIHKIIADKGISNYRLLDVGCGEGRLFGEFIENATEIVGIEPDVQRFGNAQICIKENNFQDKVRIYNSLLEDAKLQETFDIVLSSHIIQHIPSHSVNAHLEKLASLTTDGGLLIINTNTSNRSSTSATNWRKIIWCAAFQRSRRLRSRSSCSFQLFSGYSTRQSWYTSLRSITFSQPDSCRIRRKQAGRKTLPLLSLFASMLPMKRILLA